MSTELTHIKLVLPPDYFDSSFDVEEDWDSDCNVPLENYSKYITLIDEFDINGKPIKVRGVYYEEIAAMSGRAVSDFCIEVFYKGFLWGRKEDFEFAYNGIQGSGHIETFCSHRYFKDSPEEVKKMKQEFKENFLDNYEFGRSLLMVG